MKLCHTDHNYSNVAIKYIANKMNNILTELRI